MILSALLTFFSAVYDPSISTSFNPFEDREIRIYRHKSGWYWQNERCWKPNPKTIICTNHDESDCLLDQWLRVKLGRHVMQLREHYECDSGELDLVMKGGIK